MINRCMALLVEELRADGIAEPLAEEFTLGAVWDDLCRLSGETPPAAVRQMFEGESPAWDTVVLHAPQPPVGTPELARW
jgi:hypothetical protein